MTSPLIGSTLRSLEPKSLRSAIRAQSGLAQAGRAQSGIEFAPPHIEPLARPDGMETERRLERELSKVLSRPPAKRLGGSPGPSGPLSAIEPDEPQPQTVLFVGAHFQSPEKAEPSDHGSGSPEINTEIDTSEEFGAYSSGVDVEPRNANWLKTARRARRNRTLRLAGSWVITILVGGFIILVAAAILFGLPEGNFGLREQAVLAATPEFDGSARFPELAPRRWRLDD